jgi:hypothetical protein
MARHDIRYRYTTSAISRYGPRSGMRSSLTI